MTLANGIEFPVLVAFGLGVYIPLNSLIAYIEACVLRKILGLKIRSTIWPLFLANTISTLCGWAVFLFIETPLYSLIATLERTSRYFIFAGSAMVLIYYIKSFLIESLYIARKSNREKWGIDKAKIWKAMLTANAISYIFIGPFYLYMSWPIHSDFTFETSPDKVCQANGPWIYYLNNEDQLCKIRPDGSDQQSVLKSKMYSYIISPDERHFVYTGTNQDLWYADIDLQEPVQLTPIHKMVSYRSAPADISANNELIAFYDGSHLRVYDIQNAQLIAETPIGSSSVDNTFWISENRIALTGHSSEKVLHFDLTDTGLVPAAKQDSPASSLSDPNDNQSCSFHSPPQRYWFPKNPRLCPGQWKIHLSGGSRNSMTLLHHDKTIAKLSWRTPGVFPVDSFRIPTFPYACFINESNELVADFCDGYIYVLNINTKTVAKLTGGKCVTLANQYCSNIAPK